MDQGSPAPFLSLPRLSSVVRFIMRTNLFALIIPFALSLVTPSFGGPAVAKDNLTAELGKIMAVEKPHERLTQLAELGPKLSLAEIPRALAATRNFKQWREGIVLQNSAIRHWAELVPADAFAYVAKLPETRFKNELIPFVAARFATQNPAAAAAAVTKLSPTPSRNTAMAAIAEVWAQHDAKKAMAWEETLPDGPVKESVLNRILFTWVHLDPVAAYVRIQKLPDGTTKNMLLENVGADWGTLDPQAAIKWAASLPDGSEKDMELVTIVGAWADLDPAAAGDFAQQLSPKTIRQQAVMQVIERWATQDSHQAATWLLKMTNSQIQTQGIIHLMNFWAPEDPAGAENWLESLPNGPMREEIVDSFVRAVSNVMPDIGTRQAMTLNQPHIRDHDVEISVWRWLQINPSSAQQWLRESKLPPEIKEACLRPPDDYD